MIPGSANPLLLKSAAAAGGYQVSRSLRFNSSDSAYLSRTPGTAGNRRTWTMAFWYKSAHNGSQHRLFGARLDGSSYMEVYVLGSYKVNWYYYSGGLQYELTTTQVLRDHSAWYHLVFAFDSTQATANNRLRMYINGSEVTTFDSRTNPSQNFDDVWNHTVANRIGTSADTSNHFLNGYLADIHNIDGQALTPSSFTEVSATTGQLIPKTYSGTFGTNGFWLKFSDNSAATAATLGKDYSGNSNNWTPNNLSVTAGAGNDSLVDTPTSFGTDTGVGGEVRGNYATLNPLSKASVATLSNGNLDASFSGSSYPHLGSDATIALPSSGKWYWEITVTTVGELWTGIRNVVDGKQSTYYRDGSGGFNNIRIEASSSPGSANAASYTSGDIIGVAVNCDGSTIAWYKNGSQVGTTYSLTNVANLVPFAGNATTVGSAAVVANFGQRAFAHPVSGFKALCDTNLGAPVVAKPNTLMDLKLYTGNGSTQTISGLNFSPDLVWIKARSAATAHLLFDQIRGATYYLSSNATDAESNIPSTTLTAFTSDGFTLGSNSSANGSSVTLAAWAWDAGTSTVSNTAGSITSQVRANVSAGFSIATLTTQSSGTGTFGHGLNAAPAFYIVKTRGISSNWWCYHSSLSTSQSSAIALNLTNATVGPTSLWNNTAPTSTVISLGSDWAGSLTLVAYAFAPVVGYSSFGSYTGNGSADGPFVYTGFRPRWIVFKQTNVGGQGWFILDTARSTYNVASTYLLAQSSNAEAGGYVDSDFCSNGFKIRSSDGAVNASGGTYIYAAFAENPFQYARAR